MTNERDKEELDALVSETYRELPAPRAPDHLNQTILRMATNKGRGRADFLFAEWIKPVTLVATIALSLAIVLELSEVPETSVPMEVEPAVLEELVLEDTDPVKREAKDKIESFAASPPAPVLPVARKRAASMPDSNQPVAISTIGVSTTTCDEKARQSADTWLDCIDNLRESGLTLDADREYEAFILQYPAKAANSESNK